MVSKTGLPGGVPGWGRVPVKAKIRRKGVGTVGEMMGELRLAVSGSRGGRARPAQISRTPMTARPFFRLIQTGFGVISNPADLRQPTKNFGETVLPAQRQ